ncbi:MAG TPA: hypothetical protein VEQ40_11870, partial [Pyrinomonadaceae bacterium]|nr:hypothetical protein [Pyrinomonadaceae bacterium]
DAEALTLTEDFVPVERQPRVRDFIRIPQAKLFMDKHPAWYETKPPALIQRRRRAAIRLL